MEKSPSGVDEYGGVGSRVAFNRDKRASARLPSLFPLPAIRLSCYRELAQLSIEASFGVW
jgi:hypothetical protein